MSVLKRAWREVLSERQNHRCAYCGVRFGEGLRAFTADHVIPRQAGGQNGLYNLVAACRRCNELRGAEDAYSFFDRQGWLHRHPEEPLLRGPHFVWGKGARRTLADVWPSLRRAAA